MYFQLLGPFEVSDQGRPVPVGAGKRRALLALLLLHANEVVSAERLIDELWGERPPATSAKSVQVYVSQLRRELGAHGAGANGELLVTRSTGYLLRVGRDDVDVNRFELALAEGERALSADEAAQAAQKLREALDLWRGPALADFAYEPFAQREIGRLEEQRLVALQARIEADLALGKHSGLIGELEALVREYPLRERLHGQLMLALYRCGRQAEALEAFREMRTRLVSELGLEPSPELRELETRILAQSSELAPPARPRRSPPRRVEHEPQQTQPSRGRLTRPRLRSLLLVAGALLLGAAAYAAVAEREGSGRGARALALDLARNSVAAVDGSRGGALLAFPLAGRPTDLAAAGETVWAVTVDSAAVTAVDARTRRILRTVPLRIQPGAVAVGEGAVWVADGARGVLLRLEPGYDRVSAPIRFRRGRLPTRPRTDTVSLAAGAGGVWVTDGSERLARIEPATGLVRGIGTGRPLGAVAVGAGAVWVISARPPSVLRIDPRTGRVTDRVQITSRSGEQAPFPVGVAATADAIWVLSRNTATVSRIDPRTPGVTATVAIGVDRVPNEIAAAGRTAWVANEDGTLSRIDEGATAPRSVWVGESLGEVAVQGRRVWVGTAALDQQLPGGAG
jgi:DNA-binding SARP family transcriptional activator/DNA-binding beta-propeller fold protein YncE